MKKLLFIIIFAFIMIFAQSENSIKILGDKKDSITVKTDSLKIDIRMQQTRINAKLDSLLVKIKKNKNYYIQKVKK